jgi:hypothetical protein
MGGILLLIVARMLLGAIDSIQQEHKRRKQNKRKSKQKKKQNTQVRLHSTMCRDIANDAVDTTQALIQSQQPGNPGGVA